METFDPKDFAKDIVEIFNSETSIRIKYDLTCKLICDILDAKMVSILIYKSLDDSLICEGSYIESENINRSEIKQDLLFVLDNISIFNFLKFHGNSDDNTQDYKKFKSLFTKYYSATEEQFKNVTENYDTFKKLHNYYLDTFREDKREINDASLTGSYFKSLLNIEESSYLERYKTQDLHFIDPALKSCLNLIKERFNIEISSDGYYIGLPLYATDRYFGIIRIITSTDKFKSDSAFMERLGYYAQLTSLHIETNYYLAGYKKLTYLNEKIPDRIPFKLDEACNQLTEVVNCHGALIRLYSKSREDSIVKGFSASLENYVKYAPELRDIDIPELHKFSPSLLKLFSNDKNIVAVNFTVENFESKTIRLFYNSDEGNIKEIEIHGFQVEDLKSKIYRDYLKESNIFTIAIVPIHGLEKSFLGLVNTKNRNFVTADIEILILASRNIGLEIKKVIDSEKLKETQKKIIQVESMRNLIHQVGAPLNGMLSFMSNIVNKRIQPQSIDYKLSQVYSMIKTSLKQLNSFQTVLDFDINKIKKSPKISASIKKYLIERSIEFQAIAKAKGISINVDGESETPSESVNIDKQLMDEIMYCLIENATKYSFTQKDLSAIGINNLEHDFKSDGNIQIFYNLTNDDVTISIANWGSKNFR